MVSSGRHGYSRSESKVQGSGGKKEFPLIALSWSNCFWLFRSCHNKDHY